MLLFSNYYCVMSILYSKTKFYQHFCMEYLNKYTENTKYFYALQDKICIITHVTKSQFTVKN